MSIAAELRVNRKNTLAFIAAKPVVIILAAKTARVRTQGGGWKEEEGEPRAAQIFRIIELGANVTPPIVRTQDGKERRVDFVLLGAYDAEVAIGDSWVEGSRSWEVGDIVRANGYETRALVIERGA